MAKAKERMQALVPVDEQPYEVPENWRWMYLPSTFDNVTSSKKKLQTKEYQEEGQFAIVDQGQPLIGGFCDDAEMVYDGELPVIIFGDHTRCLKFVDFPFVQGADGVKVLKPKPFCDDKAFFYMFQNVDIPSLGYRRHFPTLGQYMVPVPPLPEQRRIVDRIESLFAKLDEAKEKAQAVVDGFETRKAAILHKVFAGELTEGWRKENSITAAWETKTLDSVCKSIYDGDHMPPPKAEQGIPFLVISNVNTGHLSFEDTRFVSTTYYESLSSTRKPEMGDVLYTLVGSYGIPVVVDDPRPFCFQRHMALLKPTCIDTYFLWYLLQTQDMYNKATDIATGTAQLTVPIKGLRAMEFNCPSLSEQCEIVRILDSLLSKEQQAHDAALAVIDRIDAMKKAVLAKAFRGELGTNDETEIPVEV